MQIEILYEVSHRDHMPELAPVAGRRLLHHPERVGFVTFQLDQDPVSAWVDDRAIGHAPVLQRVGGFLLTIYRAAPGKRD